MESRSQELILFKKKFDNDFNIILTSFLHFHRVTVDKTTITQKQIKLLV